MPSASTESVITLDQIKRKASEIVERKNSFCSRLAEEEEDEESSKELVEEEEEEDEGCEECDVEEEEEEEEEEDSLEGDHDEEEREEGLGHVTPKNLSPSPQDSNNSKQSRKRPPSPLPTPSPPPPPSQDLESPIVVTQVPSEPTTPKAVVDHHSDSGSSSVAPSVVESNELALIPPPPLDATALPASIMDQLMAKSGRAALCCVDLTQPLWQATERTLTPLWELATNQSTISDQCSSSSPAFGSSDVSKSNSELSLKGLLNQQCHHPPLNPHHPHYHHHHPQHHLPPGGGGLPATKVLFTSKLSLATDSTSSQASSVLPASTKPSSSSSSSSAAAGATAVHENSDQSSWENNSLTDESVRDELLGLVERRRPRPSGGSSKCDQGKRDSKESVLTTSSDGGFSKFSEDLVAISRTRNLSEKDVASVSSSRKVSEDNVVEKDIVEVPIIEAKDAFIEKEVNDDHDDDDPVPDSRDHEAPISVPIRLVDSHEGPTTVPIKVEHELPPPPPLFSDNKITSIGSETQAITPNSNINNSISEALTSTNNPPGEYRKVQYPIFATKDQQQQQQQQQQPIAVVKRYSNSNSTSSPKPFRRTSMPPPTTTTAATTATTAPRVIDESFKDLLQDSEPDLSQVSLNQMNADIDNLLAEVDANIRFSLNLDKSVDINRIIEAEGSRGDDSSIAKVKNDISEVRRDLGALRSDLSSDRKPLMDMMNALAQPCCTVVKPKDAGYLVRRASESSAVNGNNNNNNSSSNNRRNSSKEMEEVEKAMTQLAKTISEFHSPTSSRKLSSNNRNSREMNSSTSNNRRGTPFSSANTGSVHQTRNKFERKNSETSPSSSTSTVVAPSSPGQARRKSATPFRLGGHG